jgi:membrane-associated phospholipid phosphatase
VLWGLQLGGQSSAEALAGLGVCHGSRAAIQPARRSRGRYLPSPGACLPRTRCGLAHLPKSADPRPTRAHPASTPPPELHKLILGLLAAVVLTGCITNVVKASVHRPRPNFVPRCWPDEKPAWATQDEFGGYPVCSGEARSVNDGLKSFPSGGARGGSEGTARGCALKPARRKILYRWPSPCQLAPCHCAGHSSWSAAGLGYLSWTLLDRLQPFDGQGHVWRVVAAFSPAMGACGVGVTRVIDWWHHPSDVVTGLALGFLVSYLVFCCVLQRLSGLGSGCAGVSVAALSGVGGLELGGGGPSSRMGRGEEEEEAAAAAQPLLLRGGLGPPAAGPGASLLPV